MEPAALLNAASCRCRPASHATAALHFGCSPPRQLTAASALSVNQAIPWALLANSFDFAVLSMRPALAHPSSCAVRLETAAESP